MTTMTDFTGERQLDDPDGFYAELLQLHEGLSEAESQRLNARLILILANQIGDRRILREAMALARRAGGKDGGNDGERKGGQSGAQSGRALDGDRAGN